MEAHKTADVKLDGREGGREVVRKAKVGGSGDRGVRYRLKLSAHSGGFFSLREECDPQRVVPHLSSFVFGDGES